MSESEVLKDEELRDIFAQAIAEASDGTMSHLAKGKWRSRAVLHATVVGDAVHVQIVAEDAPRPAGIQINQPVGIAIQQEFNKVIYETIVVGFESSVNETGIGRIVLELPDQVERMQRRAYTRVQVPSDLNVNILFWHRGYTDDTAEVPDENYWQGRLVNLSAGGFQIAVSLDQSPSFRVGQLVGVQFTPMSYEKPIMAEAQIKHIAESVDDGTLFIGAEFIGLEASSQGRKQLRRISDIVGEYQERNRTHAPAAAPAMATVPPNG